MRRKQGTSQDLSSSERKSPFVLSKDWSRLHICKENQKCGFLLEASLIQIWSDSWFGFALKSSIQERKLLKCFTLDLAVEKALVLWCSGLVVGLWLVSVFFNEG